MGEERLLQVHRERVRPEWIDYNGHMNVAFYVLAFDHATDAMLEELGLGERYRERTGNTVYVLEAHVNYLAELKQGDALRVSTQLLDCDPKRLHYFHRMYHDGDGTLAATTEQLLMHIDTAAARGTAMPAEAQRLARAMSERHAAHGRPAQAGSSIRIRR